MSRQCQSQPNPVEVQFHWIILYDWNLHNPTPFMMDIKDNYLDSIPASWYSKKWSPQHRVQKLKFRALPNKIMSVFCKIEKGECHECFIYESEN